MLVDDVILDLRRSVRNKRPVVVTLLPLNRSKYLNASPARYHYFRNGIAEIAKQRFAEFMNLPDGEIVITRNGSEAIVTEDVMVLLEDQGEAWSEDEKPKDFVETFFLPDDYVGLRERFEEFTRSSVTPQGNDANEPDRDIPAKDDQIKGSLTAKTLAAMQDHLDSIDLSQFVQRQAIYHPAKRWQPVYVEHFTSIPDLTTKLFPDIAFDKDLPLFSEFRRHLDRLMIINLLLKRPFRNQVVGVNLEWTTRRTAEFHRLEHQLSSAERQRLVLELRWSDYLRDLEAGGDVVRDLKALGFTVSIDQISIDMLTNVNFATFRADYFKLLFNKSKVPLIGQPACRDAIDKLDPEKIILCQCDDPIALKVGQRIGVTKFQGWTISRMAKDARTKAT